MKLSFLKTTFLFLFIFIFFSPQILAKDTWLSVRSKNFYLIGNASEKDIRGVATKLEQFRETFRRLFSKTKFSSSIPTNVVVFKDKKSYNPFRPKLANGKPNENVAGYFQPSETVNYITLSTEGEKADTYGTIFHEYVHFILDTNIGKSDIPPWFNEGLAEFYQTFKIENDQKVTLGDIQNNHLYLLQRSDLIPLKTFFEIDNYSLIQNGNHSRSIFYAQAWALMHYLMLGRPNSDKNDSVGKFLGLVMNDVEPEKAFQQVFQTDYSTMEAELRKYVSQSRYTTRIITFNNKLVFDTEMTANQLSESEANAYLGDLLYHTREYEDAETYLKKALALDANSSLANTSIGLVKMRQRKFDEAKKYLEKAVSIDQKSYLAHYNYAYILSRESMDEFGYVSKYPSEKAQKIRESLQKAITIKPDFTESYRLLGFINMVNNESLDESISLLKKGLEFQPGNQEYALLIAQIYARQQKFAEAKVIVEKIAKTASEPELKSRAEQILNLVTQNEKSYSEYSSKKAEYDEQKKIFEEKNTIVKNTAEKPLTEEELIRIRQENQNLSLNKLFPSLKEGEGQIVGTIEKIDCIKGVVYYVIKTDKESVTLTSKDFSSLNLIAFTPEAEQAQVGCGAKFSGILSVLVYQENKDPKVKTTKGLLQSIYFVPEFFKLKTKEELATAKSIVVVNEDESKPPPPREVTAEEKANTEKQRREMILKSIRMALRKPLEGEKQSLGIVEKIECKGNENFFVVKIDSQTLKLKAKSQKDIKIRSFTNELEGFQMGCGTKFPNVQAVITYRPKDKNSIIDVDDYLVSIEFVPKTFVLEN